MIKNAFASLFAAVVPTCIDYVDSELQPIQDKWNQVEEELIAFSDFTFPEIPEIPALDLPVLDLPDIDLATIIIYWSAPLERVNGELMLQSEIGGYEIRYRINDDGYITEIVDPSLEQYYILDVNLSDIYTIEVAVFDTDGIYSDFVTAEE